jgi:glutathione S-transferase
MEGEQMKPEFLAMNPFHTIPTFKDSSGFALGESNAILRYIANKYAPEFYGGNDWEQRALIDWALDLRSMKIYTDHNKGDFANIVYPIMGFAGAPEDQAKSNAGCVESLNALAELHLKGKKFIGGFSPCIADFSLAPIIYALGHDVVAEKTGFQLPPVWKQFVSDFAAAVPVASMLTSAGGFSIGEFLASKQ